MSDNSLKDAFEINPQGIKNLLVWYYREFTGHNMQI